MSELKKYEDFDTLKADLKSSKATPSKDKKMITDFEAFMNLLREKFSNKQQNQATDGKQFS